MKGKEALPNATFFAVIIGGLAIVNMQGWERDDRLSLAEAECDT